MLRHSGCRSCRISCSRDLQIILLIFANWYKEFYHPLDLDIVPNITLIWTSKLISFKGILGLLPPTLIFMAFPPSLMGSGWSSLTPCPPLSLSPPNSSVSSALFFFVFVGWFLFGFETVYVTLASLELLCRSGYPQTHRDPPGSAF